MTRYGRWKKVIAWLGKRRFMSFQWRADVASRTSDQWKYTTARKSANPDPESTGKEHGALAILSLTREDMCGSHAVSE